MFKKQMYIGGEWVDSASGETFPVYSPSTGEVLAEVPMGTLADVDRAVEAAHQAKSQISRMTIFERAKLLNAIADAIAAEKETIARDLAMEQGKPYYREALREVQIAIDMWRDAAEAIKFISGEVLPSHDPEKRVITFYQPHGVIGAITPWNFPATIPTEYLSAGLAAGNAIVWKPSKYTPLTAIHIALCCERAGVPKGVINLVTGEGSVVGQAIASHPDIQAVGVTGSSDTGEAVARVAGPKPLLLELGGNGPVIILDDADVELAAQITAAGCFANAGQICSSTERILVHAKVHDQVVEELVKAAQAIRLGPSLDPETTMGPLNNHPTADKVDRHLRDAREKGAEILFGGGRAEGFPTSLYYQPTVIDRVTPDMLINREETFGPVAPVLTFHEMEEALALANDSVYGLNSGVFTRSLSRAFYFAEHLETGNVMINEGCCYWEIHIPTGGRSGKRTGLGRLGSKYAIQEMSQLKTVVLDIGGLR